MVDINSKRIVNDVFFKLSILKERKVIFISRGAAKICFSIEAWDCLEKYTRYVLFGMERGVDLTITLDHERHLCLSICNDLPGTVRLWRGNEESIILTKAEFTALEFFQFAASELISQDIWYSCRANEWHLQKEAAVNSGDNASSLTCRLAPRMCAANFTSRVAAFLIQSKVKSYLTSGRQKESWSKSVIRDFDKARKSIDVGVAIEKINKALGWKMSVVTPMNESLLILLAEGRHCVKVCENKDRCHFADDIVHVYNRMFKYVLQ